MLWEAIDEAFGTELGESKVPVQEFLKRKNQAWNLVGRVHFNLAENRRDDEAPFAFLATYTTQLSAHGKAQHLPRASSSAYRIHGERIGRHGLRSPRHLAACRRLAWARTPSSISGWRSPSTASD
jgi:hypothetical protein